MSEALPSDQPSLSCRSGGCHLVSYHAILLEGCQGNLYAEAEAFFLMTGEYLMPQVGCDR